MNWNLVIRTMVSSAAGFCAGTCIYIGLSLAFPAPIFLLPALIFIAFVGFFKALKD